jgi:hypothetical protein
VRKLRRFEVFNNAPTAATVTAQLKAAGLPMTDVTVYTAQDDPNHFLGRPHQYTSKTGWLDTRTGETSVSESGVDAGGSVEVFATADDAKARAKYVQGLLKASPILGTEYDYLKAEVVVRVSGKLTPEQAAEYSKAAGATLYTG